MKAYSYIRFSTPKQTWGDSERRQEQMAQGWCARKGITLSDADFADRGVSGWKGKNRQTGAFAELMKVTKPGDFILIEDNDRFSREDPITALVGLRDIVQRGVTIAFLKTGVEVNKQNFNDATVLFPNFFQAYLGNQETEKKSFRVGEAWAAKRGRLTAEKMTAKCVGWLKLSDDRLRFDVIPQRAEIVRRIFELSRSGVGANSIAKRFNAEHVKPFGRAPIWFPSYIKKILDSRAVIGEFTPGTIRGGNGRKLLEPVADYYPAVVSKELFATVHQMRKARPSYTGKSGFNVFSKLAFDRDGASMAYVNKSSGEPRKWHYLVSSKALHGLANYSAWQYDDFLASFLAVCGKAALEKSPASENGQGDLAAKQMELEEAEKQIERCADFILKGASAAIEAKMRKLEVEKAEIQRQIAEIESRAIAKTLDVAKVDWTDKAALRENLRATVKRITVDAKTKWFQAEFFDGRIYDCAMTEGGGFEISTPD